MIAALFSQLAQFGHLKYASHMSLVGAFMFALSLDCIEYMFNVPANRMGKEKVGMSTNQLQIVYLMGMIFFYTILNKYFFKEEFTWRNGLALALMGIAGALTFSKH
jgi:hypothetical protein